jgi:hypothetical protein
MADRKNTGFDDSARMIFWLATIASVAGFAYLLYGVFSGSLTHEFIVTLPQVARAKIANNLNSVDHILFGAVSVWVVVYLFLFWDMAMAGYMLALLVAFLNFGIPIISQQFFLANHKTASVAATMMFKFLADASWAPGIPAGVLILMDMIRHGITGLEKAIENRKRNMRYGTNVQEVQKPRNQFLGPCWNMPFCNEKFRSRCPIFTKKRGACWHNKRGCMCDQNLVQQIMASEFKRSDKLNRPLPVANASPTPERQNLSPAAKRERCRQCIIYNQHQEQKYKALVSLSVVGFIAVFVLYGSMMIDFIKVGYVELNNLIAQFSYRPIAPAPHSGGVSVIDPHTITMGAASDISGTVSWGVLLILSLIVLSKVFEFIEYLCFRLKM